MNNGAGFLARNFAGEVALEMMRLDDLIARLRSEGREADAAIFEDVRELAMQTRMRVLRQDWRRRGMASDVD